MRLSIRPKIWSPLYLASLYVGVRRISSRDLFAPGETPQCHALTEVAPRIVSRSVGTGTWMSEFKKPGAASLCSFATTSILQICSTVIIVTMMLKSLLGKIMGR